MVRLSLLLCSLIAVALPASAQTRRAVMEGLPASANTIYVDTNTVRVGVGTASPSYSVDVVGDVRASGFFRGNGSLLTGLPVTSTAALQAQIDAVAVSTGAIAISTGAIASDLSAEITARGLGDSALGISTGAISNRVGLLEGATSTTVFTTNSYADPSWITSLSTSKISLSTVTSRLDEVGLSTAALSASTTSISVSLNSVILSTQPLTRYANWDTAYSWGPHAGEYLIEPATFTYARPSEVIPSTATGYYPISVASATYATTAGNSIGAAYVASTQTFTGGNTFSSYAVFSGSDTDVSALDARDIDVYGPSPILSLFPDSGATPEIAFLTSGGLNNWRFFSGDTLSSLYIAEGTSGSRHVLEQDGDVGIKTLTPLYALDVNGGIHTVSTVTADSGFYGPFSRIDLAISTAVYNVNSYADPSWITSIAASKVAAGSLGSSVIASSLAVSSIHNSNIQDAQITFGKWADNGCANDQVPLRYDGSWICGTVAGGGGGKEYYFSTDASDVSPYKLMLSSYQAQTETEYVTSVTALDVAVSTFITQVGYPTTRVLPDFQWETYLHARRVSGTRSIQMYAEVYARTSGGVERIIGTTERSPILTATANSYKVHFSTGVVMLAAGERIVTKIKAESVSGAGACTIGFTIQGSIGSHQMIPTQALDPNQFISTGAAFGGDVSGLYTNLQVGDDSHLHSAGSLQNVVSTGTAFGGDVSGTYGAIVVADNSHIHSASSLQNVVSTGTSLSGDVTGTYSSTVVGNDSHTHSATSLQNVVSTGTALSGDVTGTYDSTVVGNDSHTHSATSLQNVVSTGTSLSGDVSGAYNATVVADNSHLHGGVTVSSFRASTDTLAGDVSGSYTSTVVADDSHLHGGVTIGSFRASTDTLNGDVTGGYGTTVVGDNSHLHGGVTISSFRASTDTLSGDVTGSYGSTVVGDDSHAHTGTTLSAIPASIVTSEAFPGSYRMAGKLAVNTSAAGNTPLEVAGNFVSSGAVQGYNLAMKWPSATSVNNTMFAPSLSSTYDWTMQFGKSGSFDEGGVLGYHYNSTPSLQYIWLGPTRGGGITMQSDTGYVGVRKYATGTASLDVLGTINGSTVTVEGQLESQRVIASSFTSTPGLCLNGDCKTAWPTSSGGVLTSTFTFALHSGGEVFVSSGSFAPNLGMVHVVDRSTITITGVKCYTVVSSTKSPTSFNIARSTDTGSTSGWSYLFTSSVTVQQDQKYTAWTVPDANSVVDILPAAFSLHTIVVPASGSLPQEYGCIIRYWRRLDE